MTTLSFDNVVGTNSMPPAPAHKPKTADQPARMPNADGRSRPTIRDVALAAGVSVKTVSRVLNDEPYVRPTTAAAVRAAATRLRFQRHEAAASLRRLDSSTHVIGLVIEDVSNPFYSIVVRAVEEVARTRGYLLLVASSDEDPQKEREVLRAFCSRRVDALIVVPAGTDHQFLASELSAGTAVVFVDRPGTVGKADSVVADNAAGARLGVEHLAAHGHRRIAYIGDRPGIYTADERLRGYLEALAAIGVEPDESLIRVGAQNVEAAERETAALLAAPAPPTAVFAGNNRLAVGVVRALRRHDRHVAVVGFDDFELADTLDPPVTVVAQDASLLGRTAAELVFSRLDGETGPARHLTLEATLIVRGSGEVPPR
jgi:LacI family transcriptional regulator